jgi:hypothetical protein
MEENIFNEHLTSFISIPLDINIEEDIEENRKLLEKENRLFENWIEGSSDFIGDISYPRVCTMTKGNVLYANSRKGRVDFEDNSRVGFYNSIFDKLNWISYYNIDYFFKHGKYPELQNTFEKVMYSTLGVLKIRYMPFGEGATAVASPKWNVEKLENPEYLRNFIFSKEGYIVKGLEPIIKDTISREILEKIV